MKTKTPKVTRIGITRLFNLGSYEHIKYELTVDVPADESAGKLLVNLEKVMEALKPERACCVQTDGELERAQKRIDEMLQELLKNDEEEFRRKHGHFEGTPLEYVARCKKMHDEEWRKRRDYKARAQLARELLDNLGGEVTWKDHKLDWEDQL